MTRPSDPMDPPGVEQSALCLPLERAADVQACGAKAVNLGRMLRAGLAVPPGFVLSARALREFIAQDALRERLAQIESDFAQPGVLDAAGAEARIETLFASAPLPQAIRAELESACRQLPQTQPLAVRSSAVGEDGAQASFAGLLSSTLGVEGIVAVERALKKTWASLWSARAAAYGRSRGHALAGMAVIIQAQVQARFAGVLFTRSPWPGQESEMLCEYCAGTAERLVSGEITPAQVTITRERLEVRSSACVDSAVVDAIDHACVQDLANAALTAERLFAGPQDIEWALDQRARMWLVQSRPITALPQARPQRIVWSNANVNENFPTPVSPLLYSIAAQGYTFYFRNLGRAFGLSERRLERMAADLRSIIGVHGGRMYYNLSAIHSILRQAPFGDRLVAWFNEFTGAAAQASDSVQRGFVRGLGDALELVWIGLRTTWQYVFIERRVGAFEARVDAFAARNAPARLDERSLIELRAELRAFLDIRLNRWNDAALADAAAMVCYGLLKATVERVFPDAASAHLHNSLLKGITGLKSAEPVAALWALAHAVRADARLYALFQRLPGASIAARLGSDPHLAAFNVLFQRYLESWGFRCSGELMLTIASFQEQPAELLEIIRAYARQERANPAAQLDAQKSSREAITAQVLRAAQHSRYLRWLPWPNRAMALRGLTRMTQAAIGLRERARYKQALLYSRLRRIALAAGTKLTQRGLLSAPDDVFFLSTGELDDLISGVAMYPRESAALVRLRREAHANFDRQTLDDTLVTAPGEYPTPKDERSWHDQQPCAASMRGMSVCGGVARGPAKVLSHASETHALSPGDILVTRQTDPGWAVAFGAIAGLVLERGGMLSHGAILAREYGIPTVVGVAGAADRIHSGTLLEVDAERGAIHLLAYRALHNS